MSNQQGMKQMLQAMKEEIEKRLKNGEKPSEMIAIYRQKLEKYKREYTK